LPGARVKLYLDFTGINWSGMWGNSGKTPGVVPAYDVDGDASTFSATEQANIREIWSRVAEAYSPFNIDVTTTDPGTPVFGNSTGTGIVRMVIGGTSDWYQTGIGGVSNQNGYVTADNSRGTGWCFAKNCGAGNPTVVADVTIHESGHLFGLYHQRQYDATGKFIAEYRSFENDAVSAPFMGTAYYRQRGVWSNGTIGYSNGTFVTEDDIAQIASCPAMPYNDPWGGLVMNNDFGFRPDDYGNTPETAAPLSPGAGRFVVQGVIEQTSDVDFFRVWVPAGLAVFNIDPAAYGGMLDAKLLIVDSAGNTVVSVDPAIDPAVTGFGLSASWRGNLSAGTYYIGVASSGHYGDVGQYTLTGTVLPVGVPEPGSALGVVMGAGVAARRRR
jgi:hypothetical protein